MLDRFFVMPETVDRIRSSWIGECVERYVAWMTERNFASRTVCRRVPVLIRFGEFARVQGASTVHELPGHVDSFVARWIRQLLQQQSSSDADSPVFLSDCSTALTRFGIYKIVRRHCQVLEENGSRRQGAHISPHTFRHTAAVHLLESGVEVNVIRGWLGHAKLDTTNRYAEITLKSKEAALRTCELPADAMQGAVPPKNSLER